MNKVVYILIMIAFIVGLEELIIGGILELIADDLQVGLGFVGLLITIYSLILGVFGPVLWVMTAKYEKKFLILILLVVFILGNIVIFMSKTYAVVFIGRIIAALSAALLINLCLVIAPSLVEPKYRGRAIGLVAMGVSASIVLGLPLGLSIGYGLGWRYPFLVIAILSLVAAFCVFFMMDKVEPKPFVSIRTQIKAISSKKVLTAHLTILLFLGGHTILYAYLTPYLSQILGFNGSMISLTYLVFGIFAVLGGGVGGYLGDVIGFGKTIILSTLGLIVTLFIFNYVHFSLITFFIVLIVWGLLSWMISPALQSYLIEIEPDTSDIQQSLNNSFLHFGIAFGSLAGGVVVENMPITANAWIGGIVVIGALFTSLYSLKQPLTK